MWSYTSAIGHLLYSYEVPAKENLIKLISIFFNNVEMPIVTNNQWCMAFLIIH